MLDEIVNDARDRMAKATEAFRKDLGALRTGRATPALLDGVKVEYYGTYVPIQQVASIHVPEPRLIVIQPWDKAAFDPIEKALHAANLGVSPTNDGKVIRLALPPLTEERRRDLAKIVKKRAEEARVAIRNIRKEAKAMIEEYANEERLSDEEEVRALELLQKTTDGAVGSIDAIVEAKEKEILEF